METSASSMTVRGREQLVRQAEIAAARACRNGVTPAPDMSAVDAFDQRAQARRAAAAAEAVRQQQDAMRPNPPAWCNGAGCWQGDTHYQRGSDGTYYGGGRTCRRIGDQLVCQ